MDPTHIQLCFTVLNVFRTIVQFSSLPASMWAVLL